MHKHIKNYIKIPDCRHNCLYYVMSRNFFFGIYNEENKSFYGIRYKFGRMFIDRELHWDLDEKFGTAKPIEIIRKCPIENIHECDHKWLREWIIKEAKIYFDNKIYAVAKEYNVDVNELQWRNDRRVEWVCEHGVGHTLWSLHGDYIHGCDGCCRKIIRNKEK
ncbi:MAG: hypothetical protein ACOCP4_00800 [Candidatus Woesearchaeota archaeon]